MVGRLKLDDLKVPSKPNFNFVKWGWSMTCNIQLAGYSMKGGPFPFQVQTAALRAVSCQWRALEEASDTT